MITNTNVRDNGIVHDPIVKEQSTDKALKSLVVFELGFGGRIVEITPFKIITRTLYPGGVDTTTFEGRVSEMKPLIEFCTIWMQIGQEKEIMGVLVDKAVRNTMSRKPLIITTWAPMLVGNSRCKLAALEFADVDDLEVAQYAMEFDLEQLLEIAIWMRQYPGTSFPDMCIQLDVMIPIDEAAQTTATVTVEAAIEAARTAGRVAA